MYKTISQVNNKYLISKESAYGVEPTMTQLDFGLVQSISLSEDESLLEVSAVNTEHTLAMVEDGLYIGSITMNSLPTRAGMINLLEALFGDKDVDTPTEGKYTIKTSPISSDDLSYFLKLKDDESTLWDISGICFTEGSITVSKGQITSISLTGVFKKMVKSTETIDPETNIDVVFHYLDACIKVNDETSVLDEFTLNINWNRNADDSRGIECVSEDERRLIQRVVRHNLNLSGSYTAQLDDNNTGYVASRTPIEIEVKLSRNSNTHTFTVTGAKTTNRTNEINADSSVKVYSSDWTGVDCEVVGDIFSDS